MEYEIVTKYRDVYVINEKGQVLEYRGNGLNKREASEESLNTWKITGGWYHKGFGHIGFIGLDELFELAGKDLLYKNGKPIYGTTDIDHGTHRLQSNKDVHGIVGIYKREVN